jgi:GNAT superfamily N-acetyltransferase
MSERVQVTIRRAVPSDTPAVLELVSRIWDGQDYVAQVWEEWLGDPSGLLVAADLQGRVVGLGKLSQLTPDDWFLQGLRTHPEFEGRGVAAQIHDYLVKHWIQHGHGALRLATNALRYPVHHLCERTGFRRLGEYSWYEAPALEEVYDEFEPVAEKQAQAVLEYLHASPLFDLLDRLVDMGWEWQLPTLALLQDIARQGRLYWWQGGRGLIGYYLDEDEQRATVTPALALAACQLADLAELLIAFRRLAAQRHYDQAGWVAQLRPELSAALEAAGYVRLWDGSVYLFEKQHPTTNYLAD